MKKYDVVVVGSGSGMLIVEESLSHGLKVALIDKGPLGGTCLNLGCIPSKILIYVADRIVDIQEAGKFGIESEVRNVSFSSVMKRMRKVVGETQEHIRQGVTQSNGLDYYEGEGHFSEDHIIEVNGERIKGEKIFLASGSQPLIPPIKGLGDVGYLTNETLLQLTRAPESLIIIGGGYIAVEYGHFFAAMGTRVTTLEMADRLLLAEEPEISELLKKQLSRRIEVHTNTQAQEVRRKGDEITVLAQDKNSGKQRDFTAQKILIAVGRKSNAGLLKVENTGIELDDKGFIRVDNYLATRNKSIFAVGDANGRQMFTHVANQEAMIAVNNALHEARIRMDYDAAPHAVYSHPQIASVGLTEHEAEKSHDILVSRTNYSDIAKGEAMMDDTGFAKVIIDKDSLKILGFHIIGPYAPELIQEVINAMAYGGHIDEINKGMHIHPALSELIPVTINNLEDS